MYFRLYKVRLVEDENFYVFAYSWEHALVMVAELTNEFPNEFSKKDITLIDKKDYSDIIIEYNYLTEDYLKESIQDFYKRILKAKRPFYGGVITDDFVEYTIITEGDEVLIHRALKSSKP